MTTPSTAPAATSSEFDYVIVGSGSAGAIMAARLTEDPDIRVAVLEFGGSDRSIFVQMPTALSIPMTQDKFNWGYWSDPEPGLGGRVMDCPRGKVLGGSSSINGMAFVRGCAGDLDQWEEAGAEGWNYASLLPYYQRLERTGFGEDSYRGRGGEVGVGNGNDRLLNPLYDAFIAAGEQAGYPVTEDYNGYQQEGFGPMQMNVAGGRRQSTANAFLAPARKRPNLQIITGVLAQRVLLDGTRAVGVEVTRGGKTAQVMARREVILAAGSIGSPTLLQRSGIGPAAVLKEAGVMPVVDLPGVGANLQDHLEVYFQYRCTQSITLNGRLNPLSKAWIGARWMLTKTGLGATNHFEACAFIRSDKGVQWPDIQYHFLPAAMRYDGRAAFDGHGFQVHVGPNKPRSRGRVAIRTPMAEDAPSILFNYLTDPRDISDWRKAIRLTREILQQDALAPFRGDEIQPGFGVQSDDEIDAWVRENVESAYHPSCTCKIGRDDDPMAVLDRDCRVRGVANLRVADSSIFPIITNGNLNAPSMMVGERASDLILGRDPLPPSNAPAWFDPAWETRQRAGEPQRAV